MIDNSRIVLAKKCRETFDELWVDTCPCIARISKSIAYKYPHIDVDDLISDVTLHFPVLFRRFDPTRIEWERYISVAVYRCAQDMLRKHDPLGIKYPQNKQYPAWTYLDEAIVLDDTFKNMDAQYELTRPSN
jgi:DNA-directed RNA polymerase specialized sigma subunit